MAPTRQVAEQAFARFLKRYGAKYPKATEKLVKDRDALLAFFAFPAEHWVSLRTTNPIESTFATVRHRTTRYPRTASRAAPSSAWPSSWPRKQALRLAAHPRPGEGRRAAGGYALCRRSSGA